MISNVIFEKNNCSKTPDQCRVVRSGPAGGFVRRRWPPEFRGLNLSGFAKNIGLIKNLVFPN